MEQRSFPLASAIILGVLIGLGLALGGYFIGQGFFRARAADRFVTVKGLVERDVKANLGIWVISYAVTGPDINSTSARLDRAEQVVLGFAHAHGFTPDEIEIQPTTVNDTFANPYQQHQNDPNQRFIIKGGIKLRSSNVDAIRKASQDTGDLIKQGVVLGENYPQAPQYYFTGLNAIRPAMLAQATKSARAVAEQFAKDSRSRLGRIRQANQGVFEIMGRDSNSARDGDRQGTIDKKVRLVSTIEYYLSD
ncbi:MAG: SIMPL domain-containing protein [Candidatus Binataceae bacterium]